jgi:hypothetical protein
MQSRRREIDASASVCFSATTGIDRRAALRSHRAAARSYAGLHDRRMVHRRGGVAELIQLLREPAARSYVTDPPEIRVVLRRREAVKGQPGRSARDHKYWKEFEARAPASREGTPTYLSIAGFEVYCVRRRWSWTGHT